MAKTTQPKKAAGRKVMKSSGQEQETCLFKLKAGKHRGRDYSQEPTRVVNPVTGEESWKYPSRDYVAGDIVEDVIDLTSMGREKFELLSGNPKPVRQPKSATSFPHGQVHDGFQETTSPGDVTKTGPKEMTDEELEENHDKPEAAGEDEDLDSMSVAELKEYADEQEIDLKGATRKDDILKRIRKG